MPERIFAIMPDNFRQSMSVHPIIRPADYLPKIGVNVYEQTYFFDNIANDIRDDDIVILWIGTKNQEHISKLGVMKCRKFLRNVDSCSSDRLLFKRELELCKFIDFEAMLVVYCTINNMQFLRDRGVNAISYPHLLDFSSSYFIPAKQKNIDIFISGQMSEKSYPLRTRLAKLFMSQASRYRVAYLQHPGHKLHEVRHDVHGEKYIELASQAKLSVSCTGDDDAMVMKYLEFAKAGTVPLGDVPSNMPDIANAAVVKVCHGMTDEEILRIVDSVLQQNEILDRLGLQYQASMSSNFDISYTKQVFEKILLAKYDN